MEKYFSVKEKEVTECKVRGSKRYSYDLPQAGLEIPCTLTFSGDQSKIVKIIKDIMLAEESKKKDERKE